MELIIIYIWGLAAFTVPFIFLFTAYYTYFQGAKALEIILRLVVAFIAYAGITSAMTPFFFFLLFAGAHTEPPGNVLNSEGLLLYSALALAYIFFCWLLASLIKGNLINPVNLFGWGKTDLTNSIFEIGKE